MRVILDTSIVLGESQSSFRYFSGLIPHLKKVPDLNLELVPSPYMKLPEAWYSAQQSYQPLLPSAPWLPQGKIRNALSFLKKSFEQTRKKKAFTRSGEKSLFHSFFYTLPPSPEIALVTMAHDATVEILATELNLSGHFEKHLKEKKESLQRAKRIIAVSECTKRDIAQVYDISPSRIDCIYHSVALDFFPAHNPAKSHFNRPYLLQVGGRMHHRNFSRLVEAFALGGFQKDYLLVCAGEPWSTEETHLIQKWGLKDSLVLVDTPTSAKLRELYQQAEMLVYPSLYEGFGFPLVEAMACGTPVATSKNGGSIPEIAAEAALYFDPRDPSDMAKTLTALLAKETSASLVKKGFENVKRFSWDKAAEQTVACYRRVFSE
ncbi:MAG: glycosyltransferase family 1 protein [Proteobacteria bacterium]|nr:glycosyltransferase family 1 protein [Pseudomonadota bacterium]